MKAQTEHAFLRMAMLLFGWSCYLLSG